MQWVCPLPLIEISIIFLTLPWDIYLYIIVRPNILNWHCAGRLVEDMENKIRNTLNEIYFGKTKDIVNGLRSVVPLKDANSAKDLQVNQKLLQQLTI